MLNIIIGILLILLVWGNSAYAQEPSFEKAVELSSAINSEHQETEFLISSNSDTLIFKRKMVDESPAELLLSIKNEYDTWGQPLVFPRSYRKRKSSLHVVGFSNQGYFYFLEKDNANNNQLYKQYCDNRFCLLHAKTVDINLNGGVLQYAYVHPSDSIIVLSIASDEGDPSNEEELYVTTKGNDGLWGDPIHLGVTINSEKSEITPFLSLNKQRLFFSSNRPEGLGGYDIYYSDRLYDSWILWTVPRRLDESVNSSYDEKYFYLNQQSAYFISNRNGNKNIYVSQIIEYDPLRGLDWEY